MADYPKATTKIITPAGYEWYLSIGPEPDGSGLDLLNRIAEIEAEFQARRIQPPATVQARDDGLLEFSATRLEGEVIKDKSTGVKSIYWSILGPPPYHKFGVRVWYETIEQAGVLGAGVDPRDVKSEASVDMTGWTAVCEQRDKQDGSGKKAVVIDLIPPAGASQPKAAPPAAPKTDKAEPVKSTGVKPKADKPAKTEPKADKVTITNLGPADDFPKSPATLLSFLQQHGSPLKDASSLYHALGGWPDFTQKDSVGQAIAKVLAE